MVKLGALVVVMVNFLYDNMLTPMAKLREAKEVTLAILTLYVVFGRTWNTTGAHWLLFR